MTDSGGKSESMDGFVIGWDLEPSEWESVHCERPPPTLASLSTPDADSLRIFRK